jgi:hypothetical protein
MSIIARIGRRAQGWNPSLIVETINPDGSWFHRCERWTLTTPIFMGDNESTRRRLGSKSMSTTKTTLEMSETLFRRAKATAAGRGQTLKQFVTVALEKELGSSESDAIVSASAALRKVRLLAKINAASWQTDQDAVAAVREQRRG